MQTTYTCSMVIAILVGSCMLHDDYIVSNLCYVRGLMCLYTCCTSSTRFSGRSEQVSFANMIHCISMLTKELRSIRDCGKQERIKKMHTYPIFIRTNLYFVSISAESHHIWLCLIEYSMKMKMSAKKD